jgi:hypothetical protein
LDKQNKIKMIDTASLVKSALSLAKHGTSGYFTQDQMNDNIALAQKDILKLYGSLFERTRVISDDVKHLITNRDLTTTGALPADYFMLVRVSNKTRSTPVYPIDVSQVDTIQDNYIRRPENSGQSYYYTEATGLSFLAPSDDDILSIAYMREPVVGTVLYSYNEDDGDYVTISTSAPLDWPDSVYNLFLYKLLDRMGFEQKDQLQIEYANKGFSEELVKLAE